MASATLLATIFLIPIPFFVLSIIIIKQKRKPFSSSSAAHTLPPGPKRLPVIGNLHQLGGSSLSGSIQRLSKQHGPFMFLQLGSIKTLVISSADAARDIFRDHDIIFSGRPSLYAANKLTYDRSDISFAPYGQAWRESRKVATLDLLSSKKVQSFNAVRAQETELLVQRIASAGSRPVNLNKLAMLLANNIVSRVTFGKKFEGEDEDGGGSSRFDRVLHETRGMLTEFNLADYFPWMKWINWFNGVDSRLDKAFRELDGLFEEMIAEHQHPKRPQLEHQEDMLDLLLRLQTDPNQNCLNDLQLKGLIVDMFVAGTDTSASTIVWLVAELIKNPSTMKRAQDEIRGAIEGKRRRVEETDLHKLSYLKAALKEALRLHPPVPLLLPRETIKECTVSGYRIPAGTRVLIDAGSIGTDPNHWDEPHKFRPERFLEKSSSVDFRGHHFELIPFGVGRRGCPGVDFAVVMVELAVANLLGVFDWSLPEGMRTEDVDMEEENGITTFKKTPLRLVPNYTNY